MQVAVQKLFAIMPFLFGIGFIAPLIAQIMAAAGWDAPLGMERIVFGLLIGAAWGLYATVRGRWI
ncbi:MAG: hypothetical protein CL808_07190 [Citromicrobium sp.]|nr:hypothetical protein [Citromicrobium sp.]|tara:strand:+ start:685 stop:879 length:195 start_codon:yes stop_codon:yes gene_type:complete